MTPLALPFLLPSPPNRHAGLDVFRPLRHWIDHIELKNRRFAHLVCKVIPNFCPFERNLSFLGHTIHIPPLCKLNPIYNELVGLRFRALAYLTDVCGEDVTPYLC